MKSALQKAWVDWQSASLRFPEEETVPSVTVAGSFTSNVTSVIVGDVTTLQGVGYAEASDWQPFLPGESINVIPSLWGARLQEATLVERQLRAAFGQEQKITDLCEKAARMEALLETLVKKVDQLSPSSGGIWIPIESFGSEPYRILKVMTAVVMPSEEFFEAALFDTNLYSTGDTPEEAIRGLKSLLLDLYDSLSGQPDNQLGPEPLNQKRFLIEHIARI